MSVESDVFIATDSIGGGQEIEFTLFGAGGPTVDDAFWDISAIPQLGGGGRGDHPCTRCRRHIFEDDFLYRAQ